MAQRYVRGTSALKTQPDESYYPAAQLPTFDLVEGSAAALQPPAFLSILATALNRALMVALVICAVGSIRVYLSSATGDALSANVSLRKDIRSAGVLNDDLRAQTSVLSSTERIVRIAQSNMGMVAAQETEFLQLNLDDSSATDEQLTATDMLPAKQHTPPQLQGS